MKEKGITLIALIVTIIVLIILAGITIATLTREDGITNNANNAKEETEIANEKEIVDRATINDKPLIIINCEKKSVLIKPASLNIIFA